MEPSLRDFKRVRLHSIFYTLRHWKVLFGRFEKTAFTLILLVTVLTSWRWAGAASWSTNAGPLPGGTYIEGVVGSNVEDIELGRLVKSGLVQTDLAGAIKPDLASSWQISPDKLTYTFTLNDKVSSSDVSEAVSKNPTYLSEITPEIISDHQILFKLGSADASFLTKLDQPIFPYGPYKIDKKTGSEIRLKRNRDYFADKPYIDKLIIRLYPDKAALEKAAQKNQITGALSLDNLPKNWLQKQITVSRRHILFINSSKANLKSLKTRTDLLSGKKPAAITALDVLEVNGVSREKEYEDLKAQWKAAGIQLNVHQIALKDAVKEDLPKRNYDVLYLLVSEGPSQDPYLLWNSAERTSDGQNFAEIANADLDTLTNQYREADTAAKQKEIMDKINQTISDEKIAIQYPDQTIKYAYSPKLKGITIRANLTNEINRFDLVSSWYMYARKK